jgi:hypothetical protein
VTTKRCSRCGELRPLDAFHRDSKTRDGRRAECRECHNIRKRKGYARTGRPSGAPAGRQMPQDPIIVEHDPTGTYGGVFDRDSFVGTLFDGYWPDGLRVRMSARYLEPTARWVLRDGALHEVGGPRVLVACGKPDRPRIRVEEVKR